MADVSGKFYSATKVRTGVSPSSPGVEVGETLPPVNPPGSDLNSVGLTMPAAFAVANSPLTSNGTIEVTGAGTSSQFVKGDGSLDSTAYGTGSVTSVGLTMPSAFNVGSSPITTNGTLAVTGAGTTAQYVRGDGSLATFPGLTGFVPYTGATADVNLGTHDLTAERGTFQNNGSSDTLTVNHTSGSGYGIKVTKGGNNEALLVTKTSGSGNAMAVVGGRTSLVDLALSSVTNTAGDFLTLSGGVVHKRTSSEVRTDIGAGTVTSVAALTLGTSGTDLSSTVANGTTTPVITLNVPTASASNRGALSSADWALFNGKQAQLNGTGFVKASGTTISYDNTSYLPLTGGTLTGPLGGTSASFTDYLTVTRATDSIVFLNTTGTNQASGLVTQQSGTNRWGFGTNFGSGDDSWNVYNYTAATRYLTILSSGAFGINTNNPARQFVVSSAGANGLEITPVSSGSIMEVITYNRSTSAYTPLQFESSVYTFNRGNVLVGTTSDAGFKLDVNGTGRFKIDGLSKFGLDILNNAGIRGAGFYNTGGNNVQLYFYNSAGTEKIFLDGGTGSATFSSSVSVNGAAATTSFNVQGSGANGILLDQNSADATSSSRLFFKMNTQTYAMLADGVGLNFLSGATANSSSGSTKMILTSGGQLLVGTSSTDSGISVDFQNLSSSSSNVLVRAKNTTLNEDCGFVISANSSGTQRDYIIGIQTIVNSPDLTFSGPTGFQWYVAGSPRLTISSTGAATFSNLAGSGNRIVIANSGGTLISAVIGSGLAFDGTTLTATGGSSGSISGSGDSGTIALFTGSTSIGNSVITQSSGNVGIGTTSPFSRLHVTDSNTLTGTISIGNSQYPGLIFSSASSGEFRIDNRSSAGGGFITFYPNGQQNTLGNEAMRIATSRNVLIGTTTDNGARLQVNGRSTFTGISGETISATGVSNEWVQRNVGSLTTGQSFGMTINAGTNSSDVSFNVSNAASTIIYFRVRGDGASTFSSSVTATSFFESSDATLKTLVQDDYQAKGIESVVAKLYIKNGKQELGYFAQDLEKILPSAVNKGSDGLLNLSYREVHTAKIAYLEEEIRQIKKRYEIN
jgi:hypothetical protein